MKLILIKAVEMIAPPIIKKAITYFGRKKEDRQVIELINHDLFNTLERTRQKIHTMKFYTHGEYDRVKTRMCYDFAKHKTLKCGIRMEDMLRVRNIDTMDRDSLKRLVLSEQSKMHEDYIKSVRIEWDIKGIDKEDIDYVVHLFEKFRYDVVSSFEARINSIFGSTYNSSNFEIILAVFEMWAMGIDLLPRDMLTTFESLNGKFKDIKYLT